MKLTFSEVKLVHRWRMVPNGGHLDAERGLDGKLKDLTIEDPEEFGLNQKLTAQADKLDRAEFTK